MNRKLNEFVPPLTAEQAADAYAKGGPMWLYIGNRDAIFQMPEAWRSDMIDDIAVDSPAQAREVARDIFKKPGGDDDASVAVDRDRVTWAE
jgi:hypothetical protein